MPSPIAGGAAEILLTIPLPNLGPGATNWDVAVNPHQDRPSSFTVRPSMGGHVNPNDGQWIAERLNKRDTGVVVWLWNHAMAANDRHGGLPRWRWIARRVALAEYTTWAHAYVIAKGHHA